MTPIFADNFLFHMRSSAQSADSLPLFHPQMTPVFTDNFLFHPRSSAQSADQPLFPC
jgi:hypothetical protein